MSGDPLLYVQPQHYPAVVTDRWGRFETTLINDGQNFEMVLRGNRFGGSTIDGLELEEPLAESGQPPDLNHGDLCSCTIEWAMPIEITISGAKPIETKLNARLRLGDPAPNNAIDHVGVTLALQVPGGVVETSEPQGWMEEALLDLIRQLPDGICLAACFSCALSDYHPAGSGFIGSMAYFRDVKDEYRAVRSKRDLFKVWPQRTGFVQETFSCQEFAPRELDTGYRGWPFSF